MIRNQTSCGSCWAFSAMNSLSDRYCIAKSTKNSLVQKFFSVDDVLSCCDQCNGGSGNGCYGGIPYYAFKHAETIGIVSGETSKFNGFCRPYFLEIPGATPMKPATCSNTCTNPKNNLASYALDKTKISGAIIGTGESLMIAALNDGGSITAAYTVYQDFYVYKTGIYRHVSGNQLGAHAVRVIGYGVENGQKYWLVANSWGEQWGEKGFFRIARGVNECGIEANMFAAAKV